MEKLTIVRSLRHGIRCSQMISISPISDGGSVGNEANPARGAEALIWPIHQLGVGGVRR